MFQCSRYFEQDEHHLLNHNGNMKEEFDSDSDYVNHEQQDYDSSNNVCRNVSIVPNRIFSE